MSFGEYQINMPLYGHYIQINRFYFFQPKLSQAHSKMLKTLKILIQPCNNQEGYFI